MTPASSPGVERAPRVELTGANLLRAIAVLAVLAITWTVVRNWPGFPLVPTVLSG